MIEGAPVQVGDVVKIVDAVETDINTETTKYIGRFGRVLSMDYDCGCGQTYPGDPMVLVRFSNGDEWEFWKEEFERKQVHNGRA